MPNPSIIRSERGNVRSDMIHMTMFIDSGVSEMKSQKVSCAVADCGKPRSGSIFTAWMRADGQLAGTPSVLFDAVAIVLSDEGAKALLKIANIGHDAGMLSANDETAFIAAA